MCVLSVLDVTVLHTLAVPSLVDENAFLKKKNPKNPVLFVCPVFFTSVALFSDSSALAVLLAFFISPSTQRWPFSILPICLQKSPPLTPPHLLLLLHSLLTTPYLSLSLGCLGGGGGGGGGLGGGSLKDKDESEQKETTRQTNKTCN